MRSSHFDVQGFSRTYLDLFLAAGFSVGVFYLFAAVLAWQLGRLPAETLARLRITAWHGARTRREMFVADLSPATIRGYVNTAKSVVASARDEEGKMLFPRAWDDEFIDVPFIEDQKQPTGGQRRHGSDSAGSHGTVPHVVCIACLPGLVRC